MQNSLLSVSDPVTRLPQISDRYASLLAKLQIFTIQDLLTHFPRYHKDTTEISEIGKILEEDTYTIKAMPESVASIRIRGGKTIQKATLTDGSGSIGATWFNQPYLKKLLKPDHEFIFSGKAKTYRNSLTFFSDTLEPIIEGREQVHLGRLSPQYKLTAGVSIKWLRNRLKYVIDNLEQIEGIKDELRESRKTQEYSVLEALKSIHFPSTEEEIERARKYLSLLELVNLQLKMLAKLAKSGKVTAPDLVKNDDEIKQFIKSLPFELTKDQLLAIEEILENITTTKPMNRLLQGDVGSGKTVVAVIAAIVAKSAGFQTAVLAPTTVLAQQHFTTFSKFLENVNTKISIELVTAANKKAETADILIGTSAVLARQQKLINKLGLVIVDEQHRFGVKQREELLKPFADAMTKLQPHLLNMTATPIPRTLALALFSDLEVSTITTMPKGRLPIKTFLVQESKRKNSYEWIKNKVVKDGEQIYWISPLIEESDKLEINSAKAIYKHLSEEIFPDLSLGLLHGKLKAKEKDETMEQFKNREVDVLISTSVIEVGIDVPNATVMVIEGAERFGLAQLHQLRGRVGRSEKQSWCFLFPTKNQEEDISKATKRLEFFAKNTDGLRIAEYDLETRGPGEVYGTRQSGIPDLKIATLTDLKQIQESKKLARELFEKGTREISLYK